jgi:sugar lactone lactonase YvrE
MKFIFFFLLTKSKTFVLIIFNSKLTKSKFLFNTIFTKNSKFIFKLFLLRKNLDRFLFFFLQNQNTFFYLQIKSILSFDRISFHLSFQIKTFLSDFDSFYKKTKILLLFQLFKSISSINFSFSSLEQQLFIPNLTINQTWKQYGTTKAGGHGQGNGLNQLSGPHGVFIDDDQTIYVADTYNHRIVEWKSDANNGQIVEGGNGEGKRNDQLNQPTKVIVDKENDSLIICDRENRRVVRWPHRNGQSGETLISNIACLDLIMDNDRYLYVCDNVKDEVRRWKMGETNGTIAAGGNGRGNRLDQLNDPYNIFIDEDHSVYVSDCFNHRVMKWVKDAKEGIVVAGGQGQGNGLRQLSLPHGIIVDQLGSVYIADSGNHRVIRWLKGAQEGTIVVGGNGRGEQPNQFNYPCDLSFDRQKNLYVVEFSNHRVQKFDINSN